MMLNICMYEYNAFSIRVENRDTPDQMASLEASFSGYSVFISLKGQKMALQ